MASHSPQRPLSLGTAQAHRLNQALPQNLRESSRSPSLRERSRAMPAAPSSAQMYTPPSVTQQLNQIPPQASPTGSNKSRPSPPTASIPRHHATPPQASVSPSELGGPQSLSQGSQNGFNAHYIHTISQGRAQAVPLTLYQNLDTESYQITPELLEEIERADRQQSQTHSGSPAFTNYPRNGSTTPPRDHNIERVRAADRVSPKLEPRRQRDPVSARESPIARQPHSPSTFAQAPSSIPDRRTSDSSARSSPLGGESSGETYTAYMTRDSPIHSSRRATVGVLNSDSRSQFSVPAHTPPLQATQARPPDRSLPVQEELEDEPHPATKDDPWKGLEHLETHHRNSSPTPSSALHPEGNTQHRGFDFHSEDNSQRFEARHPGSSRADHYPDDQVEEGAKTPRSPSVGLPDKNTQPMMGGIRVPMRATGRVSSMDQLGLRGIDQTIYQPNSQRIGHPAQQHRLTVDPNMSYHTYYADDSSPFSGLYLPEEYYTYDPPAPFHPDAQYDNRSRPDAPIPPTPHSQTAAPSPSPFPHARNGFAVPSPVHAGSPYPAPFEHVRRNIISRNARHNVYDPRDPNFDINMIREQVAGQWQKYAQNTHALGNMSDSTFSPSATPFQGNFAPWAHLHARRTLGQFDLRSMQSSPALGDVPSVPPTPVFRSKKKQHHASKLGTEVSAQAPPRVQSTQPRDTSPEPSTSGEETAGEDDYLAHNLNRNNWGNGSVPVRVIADDGDGDWVDEDEEPDEDDLLELEYHPTYVKNDTKRRRRWETGWESLLEAFHTLDRQTDATMVLLAAPDHSTRLYSVRSRSLRRQNSEFLGPDITPLKAGFKRIAVHRRGTRSSPRPSLVDRFLVTPGTSGEGSDSDSREEVLKRAFGAALNTTFEQLFAERERRWAEEMKKISEDRERVEMLLKQVIGTLQPNGSNTTPTAPPLVP